MRQIEDFLLIEGANVFKYDTLTVYSIEGLLWSTGMELGQFFRAKRRSFSLILLACVLQATTRSYASAGTSGATFLQIPIGARPAALGGAYTALATDAYAPTWNPGALADLPSNELAATHLSYLQSFNYEYASFVHPLSPGHGLGLSLQYFGAGSFQGTDVNANPLGNIGGYYAAGSVAYGQKVLGDLSIGVTLKRVQAQLDDVSAGAWAGDAGAFYPVSKEWQWGAGVSNVGSKLTFLQQGDSLPLNARLATAYAPIPTVTATAQMTWTREDALSGQFGVEWTPVEMLSLRTGYRTDTTQELSALAGFSLGLGLHFFNQEFGYAWLPMGDLGSTQYFSFLFHFGEAAGPHSNLVQLPHSRPQWAKRHVDETSVHEDDENDITALMIEGTLAPAVGVTPDKKP